MKSCNKARAVVNGKFKGGFGLNTYLELKH